MNSFWHFGDSFAYNDFNLEFTNTQYNNFGHIISKKLELDYQFRAVGGYSNDDIFLSILKESNNFKEGDVLFINWSFFSRGSYVDVYDSNHNLMQFKEYEFDLNQNDFLIKSTNHWFNENDMKLNEHQANFEDFISNYKFMMDYILNYNFDYNLKLFHKIFTYLKTLDDKNIKIYNLFIRDSESLYHNDTKLKIKFKEHVGYFLNFEPSYFDWLVDNEYKGEQEGHYSEGIQEILANHILYKMKNYTNNNLI